MPLSLTQSGGILLSSGAVALASPAQFDTSLIGTWYFSVVTPSVGPTPENNPDRLSVTFTSMSSATGAIEGVGSATVDNIVYASNRVSFRLYTGSIWYWVDLFLTGRAAKGRAISSGSVISAKPAVASFAKYCCGWKYDNSIAPRCWDIRTTISGHLYYCMLRIDQTSAGSAIVGTFKQYAIDGSWTGEGPEYQMPVARWDGVNLVFTKIDDVSSQVWTSIVSGRSITGSFISTPIGGGGSSTFSFAGVAAHVLTRGLNAPDSAYDLQVWQSRVREEFRLLTMPGVPSTPPTIAATQVATGLSPIALGTIDNEGFEAFGITAAQRDDNPAGHSANYTRSHYTLSWSVPDIWGGSAIFRSVDVWLAVPTTSAPSGGYPIIIAANGHAGNPVTHPASAHRMLDENSGDYCYGTAFARRGCIVLCVSISHRPAVDSAPLYSDFANGNDPSNGCPAAPAICSSSFAHTPDWEERGESCYDVQQALTALLNGQLGVVVSSLNASKIIAVGLSLGAEVVTLLAALDMRVSGAVVSGFSADLNLIEYSTAHNCYKWRCAAMREFVDWSDVQMMIAPRPFVVQSGAADPTYTLRTTPFSADKTVLRRSRAAWAAAPNNLVHHIAPHVTADLTHRYHFGDTYYPSGNAGTGILIPSVAAPANSTDLAWQDDAITTQLTWSGSAAKPSLFDLLAHFGLM